MCTHPANIVCIILNIVCRVQSLSHELPRILVMAAILSFTFLVGYSSLPSCHSHSMCLCEPLCLAVCMRLLIPVVLSPSPVCLLSVRGSNNSQAYAALTRGTVSQHESINLLPPHIRSNPRLTDAWLTMLKIQHQHKTPIDGGVQIAKLAKDKGLRTYLLRCACTWCACECQYS